MENDEILDTKFINLKLMNGFLRQNRGGESKERRTMDKFYRNIRAIFEDIKFEGAM